MAKIALGDTSAWCGAAELAAKGHTGPGTILLHACRGEVSAAVCGVKSVSLDKLSAALPASRGLFTVPKSFTLPFGTCEAVLAMQANADVDATIKRHVRAADEALEEAAAAGRIAAGMPVAGSKVRAGWPTER